MVFKNILYKYWNPLSLSKLILIWPSSSYITMTKWINKFESVFFSNCLEIGKWIREQFWLVSKTFNDLVLAAYVTNSGNQSIQIHWGLIKGLKSNSWLCYMDGTITSLIHPERMVLCLHKERTYKAENLTSDQICNVDTMCWILTFNNSS